MTERLRSFARDFVRAFFEQARRVFVSADDIEIVAQQDTRLVWRSVGQEVVADLRLRALTSNGRVLARFDAIESIDIAHEQHGDGPESWSVSLCQAGRSRLRLARSTDATDASILAAHLSTLTGKKVLALR